ncbi:MAG: adenosine deaminase [Blautia sp.]|nr:adenosine deaminase [Blautia sp.]
MYLDKEKDIVVDLYREGEKMFYCLRTPNHRTGNLITNFARLCCLPLSFDEEGRKVVWGEIPCYYHGEEGLVYVFRLGNTKIANISPEGKAQRKASIPAISKTLMSQTKDYMLDEMRTIVKTYVRKDVKFTTDLHTHMNGILDPDVLIALGIHHQIRYPLYYVKKLGLRLTEDMERDLRERQEKVERQTDLSGLTGKYRQRRIDDNTFINFARLILGNLSAAAYNIDRIRVSLTVPKDGQAVFANLEKVYLYRYVFTKGLPADIPWPGREKEGVPEDVAGYLKRMEEDRRNPDYADNTLFQDKLLWIARTYQSRGIHYVEISDTSFCKEGEAIQKLSAIHQVMPAVTRETGVLLRFLAGIRRIPLTIVKDKVETGGYLAESLRVISAVFEDPYLAGADILGEEINDITELSPVIGELVGLCRKDPTFVIRIHAGENDALRDNVANSVQCVIDALSDGQDMPRLRIGHGLYTANLSSGKGKKLLEDLRRYGVVLEFQITSNVRLNNLTGLENHPLRRYLRAGVLCVQGTDGGALYGTDSVDEELSLERFLGLTHEELLAMRRTDARLEREGISAFEEKTRLLAKRLGEEKEKSYLTRRLEKKDSQDQEKLWLGGEKTGASLALAEAISQIPEEGVPVIVAGGSFSSDRHRTVLREEGKLLLEKLVAGAGGTGAFFVIGHRLTGYEAYVLRLAKKAGIPVFAFVPSMVTGRERERLLKSGVKVRVSIEPYGVGLYKSVAYEVFKRRYSILLALDGSGGAANLVQEAKNAKYPCSIYVDPHCRALRAKARSLTGYVSLLGEPGEDAAGILEKMKTGY